ncbi:MAG: hypothetical protein Q9173_001951 [Seirophora scorigena]
MGYVTNLPAIWTLILDLFPRLSNLGRGVWNTQGSKHGTQSRIARAGRGQDYQPQNSSRWGSTTGTPGVKKAESQEYIAPQAKGICGGLKINKDVTFTVRRNTLSDKDDFAAAKPGDKVASADRGGYSKHCNAV